MGCGKTVVAFLASLLAHADGYQTAMMCPTEVLAEQHIRNFEAQFAQLPEVGPDRSIWQHLTHPCSSLQGRLPQHLAVHSAPSKPESHSCGDSVLRYALV